MNTIAMVSSRIGLLRVSLLSAAVFATTPGYSSEEARRVPSTPHAEAPKAQDARADQKAFHRKIATQKLMRYPWERGAPPTGQTASKSGARNEESPYPYWRTAR